MINVFLDIDSTLTEAIQEDKPSDQRCKQNILKHLHQHKKNFVRINPYSYFLYPGTLELIQYFNSLEDVSLKYFSLGTELRNHRLISKIHHLISDQKTPYVIPTILSRRHSSYKIVEIKTADGYEISYEYEKDFTKFIPMRMINNSVLIDDRHNVAPNLYAKSLLKVPPEPFRLKELLSHEKHDDKAYKLKKEFYSNNKIFYIAGLFTKAYKLKDKKRCSFSEALATLQDAIHKNDNSEHPKKVRESIIKYGLKVLTDINPDLQLVMPSTSTPTENIPLCTQYKLHRHREGKTPLNPANTIKDKQLEPILPVIIPKKTSNKM